MSFLKYYLKESDEKFNLDSLNSLVSYSKKIKYAKEHLTKLGEGSSRIVFDLNDGYVLKLAKNEKGLEQNLTDGDWGLQKMYPDLIPELKDKDESDDCYWIISKKCSKITPNRFKDLTKISFKDFSKAITEASLRHHGRLKTVSEDTKKYLEDEDSIVNRVFDMMINYDMPSGDITRISSWRECDGKSKLIDAGLTDTTFNTFYKR